MKIIKRINTNAAMGLDTNNREVVLLGKGIGFPAVPYELEDLTKIERTFYDVNHQYLGMLAEMPQDILIASSDITEQAEIELQCQLNANLPFTLADHLHFAMQRLKNGIDLTTPLAYDVQHLYPKEYELGVQALHTFLDQTGVSLPPHEAINIAMHLINAEAESGNIHSLLMTIQIINEIVRIIEEQQGVYLERDSYNYARFTSHLRYLIQRLSSGAQVEERGADMLHTLAREYPDIYMCALKVHNYLHGTWKWSCNDEEMAYLMMHIHRVREKNKEISNH